METPGFRAVHPELPSCRMVPETAGVPSGFIPPTAYTSFGALPRMCQRSDDVPLAWRSTPCRRRAGLSLVPPTAKTSFDPLPQAACKLGVLPPRCAASRLVPPRFPASPALQRGHLPLESPRGAALWRPISTRTAQPNREILLHDGTHGVLALTRGVSGHRWGFVAVTGRRFTAARAGSHD